MFHCNPSGTQNSIKVVQNCRSTLDFAESLITSGSIYNRSVVDDVGLEQSYWDHFAAAASNSLSFSSVALGLKVAVVSPSSTLVFSHTLSVAGGRTTGPQFYDAIYNPAAGSNAQIGSWVYVDFSGNAILATSAGTLPEAEVVGCFTEAGVPNQLTELLTQGRLTLADWTALAGTEFLSPGVVYYLTTGGLMSAIAPSEGYVVVLGRAITTTEFDVSVQLPWGVE